MNWRHSPRGVCVCVCVNPGIRLRGIRTGNHEIRVIYVRVIEFVNGKGYGTAILFTGIRKGPLTLPRTRTPYSIPKPVENIQAIELETSNTDMPKTRMWYVAIDDGLFLYCRIRSWRMYTDPQNERNPDILGIQARAACLGRVSAPKYSARASLHPQRKANVYNPQQMGSS